ETIQWIDFKEEKRDYSKFLSSFNELISKLEIDREHVHQHTKWLQRALDWNGAGKSNDSLLRGNEFAIASDWLQKAKEKKYPVHLLPKRFIEKSGIARFSAGLKSKAELNNRVITTEITIQLSNANRRIAIQQKLLGFGGSLALLIIIGVAWYGSSQQQLAEQAQESARKQDALVQQTQKQAKDFEREVSQTQKELMACEQDVKKSETQTESGQKEQVQVQKGSTRKIQTQAVISDKNDLEIFQDTLADGSLGPEMVVIPAGTFRMGDIQGVRDSDEQPVHEVSIERFAMGRYEVTFAEYDQFAEATNRKKPSDIGWGRDDRPVINVSWDNVTAYAEWLSEETGHPYRLPTEAEWEYAARAGTETKYWWGNEIGFNNANCRNSFCDDRFEYTAPVGSFEANPFGLFDVSGNVWEWTCSEYDKKYSGCINKSKVNDDSLFVLRGGSWFNVAWRLRSANRYFRWLQSGRNRDCGFRIARKL
ncbi:MAG: formylglycine-generating enzyme family protein, partial [Candidatus Parabeggiatoa sp.]|nr:formylglycine-generating enzyme family protein [Candidatus Parabeggiatoa sp.]